MRTAAHGIAVAAMQRFLRKETEEKIGY